MKKTKLPSKTIPIIAPPTIITLAKSPDENEEAEEEPVPSTSTDDLQVPSFEAESSAKGSKDEAVVPGSSNLVRKVKVKYKAPSQNRLTQVIRQCRTLSKLTHHAIEHDADQLDLVVEASDHDDLIDDDLDVVDHDLDIDDLVTPPSTQRVKLQVKFTKNGKEEILDSVKKGKRRRS